MLTVCYGAGLRIFETDTKRELRYDGTGWIIMAEPAQTFTMAVTPSAGAFGALGALGAGGASGATARGAAHAALAT